MTLHIELQHPKFTIEVDHDAFNSQTSRHTKLQSRGTPYELVTVGTHAWAHTRLVHGFGACGLRW